MKTAWNTWITALSWSCSRPSAPASCYGGKEPRVAWENDKPTVVALREIAEGIVTPEFIAAEEIVTEDPVFAAFEDESNEAV